MKIQKSKIKQANNGHLSNILEICKYKQKFSIFASCLVKYLCIYLSMMIKVFKHLKEQTITIWNLKSFKFKTYKYFQYEILKELTYYIIWILMFFVTLMLLSIIYLELFSSWFIKSIVKSSFVSHFYIYFPNFNFNFSQLTKL